MTPNEKLFNFILKNEKRLGFRALLYLAETEEQIIQVVKAYPFAVEIIENPSEAVQIAAVKSNWEVWNKIKNPCDAVLEEAISCNADIYFKIKDPTEKMAIVALNRNPRIIDQIKDPTVNMMMAVIEKDPTLIRVIKNPPMEVQKKAVLKYIESYNVEATYMVINHCPDIQEFSQEVCDHLTIKDIIE